METIKKETEGMEKTFMNDLKQGVLYNLDLRNTVKEFNELSKGFKLLFGGLVLALSGYFVMVGDYSSWGILSFVGLLLSSLNLVLVDNMKLTNYLWGTLASVTSIIGAYHYAMYGDFTYYLYVFPLQAVGIVEWVRLSRKNSTGDTEVRSLDKKGWLKYTGIWLASYAIMYIISVYVSGSVPLVDSAILAFGVVGQTLMSKSYWEQWVAWILQNVTAIVSWSVRFIIALEAGESTSFPLSMIVMWVIFLVNAVFGFYTWYKMSKKQ